MTSQKQLFDKLRSPVEEERIQALRMLDFSCLDAKEHLLNLLGDDSWRIRKEAVSQVRKQPWRLDIIGNLIEFLYSDDNAGLRNSSHEILVQLGENAVSKLIEEMRVDDHDVRKFVVDILGDIGSPEAINSLIETLKDADQNVRSAAAENLGKLRAEKAVPFLLKSLDDDELLFRFSILDALGKIGIEINTDAFSALLNEPLLKKPLITCLGEVGGADSSTFLVSALTEPMFNVRIAAVRALCKLVERYPDSLASVDTNVKGVIVTQLSEVIDESDIDLVNSILNLLGTLAEATASSLIFKYLFIEENQQSAFNSLMKIGEKGLEVLIHSMHKPSDKESAYLCYLIGEIEYRGGLPFLVQSLSSSSTEIRQIAVQSLGKVGDEGSINILVESLTYDDSDIREAAVSALANLSVRFPSTVLAALNPLLESKNQDIRVAAVEILGQMGGQELEHHLALALKDPSSVVRRAAIRVMDGEFAKGHLESLRLSLTDEDVDVRKEVVELLGKTSDTESLEIILLVIANDADVWVRATAIRALINFPIQIVKDTLVSLLRDNSGLLALASLDTLDGLSGLGNDVYSVVFQHRDNEVVKEGLEILKRNYLSDELSGVVPFLLDRQEADIKVALIRAVGAISSEDLSKSVYQHFISDPDDTVRNEVAQFFNPFPGA